MSWVTGALPAVMASFPWVESGPWAKAGFWAQAAGRAPLAATAAAIAVGAACPIVILLRRSRFGVLLAAAILWVLPDALRLAFGLVPGGGELARRAMLVWPLAVLVLGMVWPLHDAAAAQAWRLAGAGAVRRFISLQAPAMLGALVVALCAVFLAGMRGG